METLVNCKGVNFTYTGAQRAALTGVDLTVSPGEFCLVIGKSGSGKSTLLKLLKKEIRPSGTLTGALQCTAAAGYLSQHVEESLVCDRVRSELSFALTNRGLPADVIELKVAEIAAYFHLESKLDRELHTLSGGEKQLVNLAAVMMTEPQMLLLDEPCAQLDPVATERFVQMIRRLHADFGCAVLAVSHDSEALFDLADTLLVMEDGKAVLKDEKEAAANILTDRNLAIKAALPVQYRMKVEKSLCPLLQDTGQPSSASAVTAENVTFAYEKGKPVLNGLSLAVKQGKVTAVIGANGCGKTTLLKVLAGVRKPLRGRVKTGGAVAMLTQNVYDLFTRERCIEETPFGEITDYLEITDIAEKHPYDLSGGEAQRLALAKVVVQDADIILLDEPTRGLDALLKIRLGERLQDLCCQGKTVLLASHDLAFCAEYADETAFLSGGETAAVMPTGILFRKLRFLTTPLARLTDGRVVAEKELRYEE